jgi:hypothetical protein
MLLLFIREVSYAFTSLWSNFIYHSRSLLAKITEKFLPKNTTATDKHNTVEVVQELEDDRASHSSKLKVETYNTQEAILDLEQNQLEVISGPQHIDIISHKAVEQEAYLKEERQAISELQDMVTGLQEFEEEELRIAQWKIKINELTAKVLFEWRGISELKSMAIGLQEFEEEALSRAEKQARWEAEQEVRTAARETAIEREDALREAHRAEEQARWEAGPGVQASEWEIALERLRARWEVEEAESQAGLEAELEVQAAELETAREREDALREAHRAEKQARWEAEQEVQEAARETAREREDARREAHRAEEQARWEAEQEVRAAARETARERFRARLKVEEAERQARWEAKQEVRAAERETDLERFKARLKVEVAERQARREVEQEVQAAERARELEQRRAAEPYTKAVLSLIDNFFNRLASARTRQPVIRKHGVLFFSSAPAARVTPPAPLTKSFVLEVVSSTEINPVITKPVTVPQDNVPEALSQQPHSYFPPEGTLAPLRKSELGVKVELPDGTILTVDTRSLPSAWLGDMTPIKNKPYIIEIAKQYLIVVSKGPDQDHQPSL